MSDGENLASMFVLVRSLAGRGRRPSTEYDAHLEISSSTVVLRVLLGSTVDQVSAASPALNLTPSVNMVLTVPGVAGDLRMEPSCSTCARYLVVVDAWVG